MVNQFKERKGCADCSIHYPAHVLDFDHRPGVRKIRDISWMVAHAATFEDVKTEIQKCDVVCANCHRQRTMDRLRG